MQGIEVAPGDEVTIETVDALKPAVLRVPEHPEFLYLLMPVRVSLSPAASRAARPGLADRLPVATRAAELDARRRA